ncbi:PTS sugar transporter subunit IIC [Trichloromonas sp.]|uniref:PTS sugar transporter subunit IIC n=1 Tax=Trichloromonas sp. TaxID=3069249 RepID=UPI003D816A46
MPFVADYLFAAGIAILAGLDRTAAMQFMVSRPIVAAPVTGFVLGDPWSGLQVGILIELMWLGRLPVGAAIPPDDTQIAVAGTALAIIMGSWTGFSGLPMILLCLLVSMPLGKAGQGFDRLARKANGWLLERADAALLGGRLASVERCHLLGVVLFAAASLATYLVIMSAGTVAVWQLAPFLMPLLTEASPWIQLAFPLVGAAMIIGTINVSRSVVLFSASFVAVFLLLWHQ